MKSKQKHLIVLAQSLEQPRIVKRIIEQSQEFDKLTVYGFKREIHAVNNFGVLQNYDNIEVRIVGNLFNEKYFQRLFTYLKLLSTLFFTYGFKQKNIYVFGLDLRMIAALIINKKLTYEISDIMWLYKAGLQKKILSKIDRFLAGKSSKVVFTSKGFYDVYYSTVVKSSSVVLKENKFKSYGKVSPVESLKMDKIRIAYIGAFRYGEIIKHLLSIAKKNPNLLLNFYGDSHNKQQVDSMKLAAEKYNNITYNGPFKNPDDLGGIYAENNLNFVVYDNSQENERVAMPNKYYESGFFNVPIVCAKNTYVGQRAKDNKMGWIIDTDKDSISQFLNNITLNELNECHAAIKKLDKTLFHLD